jgi:YihY family inner membrane protein
VSNNYVLYLAQAIKNFATKGQQEAVGFAYWAIFSLFPLLVLLIIIATSILGPRTARLDTLSMVNQFLPEGGSTLIRDTLDKIMPRQHTYTLISAIGLLFGAVRLFTNLQTSLSRIFRDERRRAWYLQPVVGIGMMIAFTGLMALSTSLAAVFGVVNRPGVVQRPPTLGLGVTLVLLFINTALLTLLFRFIPRRKLSFNAILPAAILGAIAWEVGRVVFDWYTANIANLGAIYGSLAAVMGLLMWMFFIGCLISICAEIAVATADWQAERPPSIAIDVPEPNVPADELSPTLRREFAVVEPDATQDDQQTPQDSIIQG